MTPRFVQFKATDPDAKISKIAGLGEEIALALGCARVRIARDGAVITSRCRVPIQRPCGC